MDDFAIETICARKAKEFVSPGDIISNNTLAKIYYYAYIAGYLAGQSPPGLSKELAGIIPPEIAKEIGTPVTGPMRRRGGEIGTFSGKNLDEHLKTIKDTETGAEYEPKPAVYGRMELPTNQQPKSTNTKKDHPLPLGAPTMDYAGDGFDTRENWYKAGYKIPGRSKPRKIIGDTGYYHLSQCTKRNDEN